MCAALHLVLAAARWQLLTGRGPPVHGQDHILKKSFLSAAVMLMKVLKRESSAQGYKFTQMAELVHCLLVRGGREGGPRGDSGGGGRGAGASAYPLSLPPQGALQKEPDCLVTLFRQKIILVIAGLR